MRKFFISLAIVALAAGACTSHKPKAVPARGLRGLGADYTVVATVANTYNPADSYVVTGSIVEWQLEGSVQHTVTADDGSFDSGPIAVGQSFKHKFDKPGTYAYHCTLHNGMTGAVLVSNQQRGLPGPGPSAQPAYDND